MKYISSGMGASSLERDTYMQILMKNSLNTDVVAYSKNNANSEKI